MTSFSLTTRIIFTLCFMGLITLASLIPCSSRPGGFALFRLVTKTPALMQKVLHVCIYGILALLWVWTLDGIHSEAYRLLVAFIIAVAFGGVMEWCQTMVAGRFGTMFDVALNMAGATLGLLAAVLLLYS